MTEQMRKRFAAGEPVVTADVPTTTVIQIGELVSLDGSNQPYAAADETWDTDLATTQQNFVTKFLGAARQRSRDGETDPIVVEVAGVHEFECAAATFELGDLVGPAKDTGDALLSDTVVAVADASQAVGRVVRRHPTNTTRVMIELQSRRLGSHGTGLLQAGVTALVDNTTGTPGDTLAAIYDGNNPGSADLTETKDAIASLAVKVNAVIARLEAAGVLTK